MLCCSHAPSTCCKRGHLQRTLHQEKNAILLGHCALQVLKRSPDTPSEQPAQRTSPSHECSAAVTELGEEQGRASRQTTASPAQILRAQLCAGSTTWPLWKRKLWLSAPIPACWASQALVAMGLPGQHLHRRSETEEQVRQEALSPAQELGILLAQLNPL